MDHFSYIAAQAPSEETSVLFWEMVWQQNVRVVVMLTNLVEGLGFQSTKCSLYWPELVGNTRRFGQDIEVQLYDCQEAPDYLVKYRNEQFFASVNLVRKILPDLEPVFFFFFLLLFSSILFFPN